MTRLSNLTFRTKLMGITLLLLFSLITLQSVLGLKHSRQNLFEQSSDALATAARILAIDLRTNLPGLSFTVEPGGEIENVIWDQLPADIPADLIIGVGVQFGGIASVFRWDPRQGEFVRQVTNLRKEDGTLAVGTSLPKTGEVHNGVLAGQATAGDVVIVGAMFKGLYVPIHNPAGDVIGLLGVAKERTRLDTMIAEEMQSVILSAVVMFVAASILAYLAIGRILVPLGKMSGTMTALARRDYAIDVPMTSVQDPVGDMARSILAFRDMLIEADSIQDRERNLAAQTEASQAEQFRVVTEISAALGRLSDGDLTKGIESPAHDPFPAEYDALRASYNAVIEHLNGIVMHVRDIAEGVRGGSDEISQVSKDISKRAESQAATLEQSAAALNQLTESVRSTAGRALMAQKASSDNRLNAEAGASIVGDAIKAMRGIEKSSDQITRIIGVIDDIAFQTNLLALNAGVEAARAGDAGRGFAVVASEVRLLAQRASESAREIKALISESAIQVQTGSALVNRTGESLAEILLRAGEAASLVSDIALAASEQATGLDEINSGVNQLDQVTQQNAAVAEETTAAASSLLQKSDELMSSLEGFKTIGTSAARIERSKDRADMLDWTKAARGAIKGKAPASPPRRAASGSASWQDF